MWSQWMDREIAHAKFLLNKLVYCQDPTNHNRLSRELGYSLDRLQTGGQEMGERLNIARLSAFANPSACIQRVRKQISGTSLPGRRLLLDSLPMGLMLIDNNFRVLEVNQAALRMTGRSRKSCLGEPCEEVLRGDICGSNCLMRQAWSEVKSSGPFECSHYDAKGQNLPIEYTATPITDNRGKVIGGVAVFSDISQRRAVENRRTTLLSMLVHDMKNHLLNIDTFSRQILEQEEEPATLHASCAEVILHQGECLGHLVKDFLYAAQQEITDFRLDLQSGDVCGLVRSLAEEFSSTCRESGHTVLPCLPAGPLFAKLDMKRMKQALRNLLDNALLNSPPRSTVLLRAWENDEYQCVLEVIDQGVGIHPDDLPHIFRPFFRGREMQPYIGFGLGLASVKAIVEGHGGTISACCPDGGGTIFSIAIPLNMEQLTAVSQ